MEIDHTALYIVPTPIGNLEDITLRALRILKEVDIVLAEDTRVTKKLFIHFDIDTKLESYHLHNEHKSTDYVISRIKEGKTFALVSDAGTPVISDPGFLLGRACRENNIKFECLPGATAFVPALVKSGLPADRFIFEGFLPHKKGRQTKLNQIIASNATTILYESPHRIVKTITQIQEIADPERLISVSREISKKFEETITGTAAELLAHYQDGGTIKGEFVLVIEGAK